MKNWKIWGAFLTVFATGVIVGVIGVGLVIQQHYGPPKDRAEFRENMRKHVVEKFLETVRPDAAAIPNIEAILDQMLSELHAIREEMRPRHKAIMEKSKQQVMQHLTPEQAQRFENMLQNRHRGKFGFLRLPPPPPPMP
ncbi:MAG: hypothetical protein OCC46_02405 [Pseudodesulfovibrio sp.]